MTAVGANGATAIEPSRVVVLAGGFLATGFGGCGAIGNTDVIGGIGRHLHGKEAVAALERGARLKDVAGDVGGSAASIVGEFIAAAVKEAQIGVGRSSAEAVDVDQQLALNRCVDAEEINITQVEDIEKCTTIQINVLAEVLLHGEGITG